MIPIYIVINNFIKVEIIKFNKPSFRLKAVFDLFKITNSMVGISQYMSIFYRPLKKANSRLIRIICLYLWGSSIVLRVASISSSCWLCGSCSHSWLLLLLRHISPISRIRIVPRLRLKNAKYEHCTIKFLSNPSSYHCAGPIVYSTDAQLIMTQTFDKLIILMP